MKRIDFSEDSVGTRTLETDQVFSLVRDLDGDGVPELITEGSEGVRRWDSGFDAKYGPAAPLEGQVISGLHADGGVDLDGDGWRDFVASTDEGEPAMLWTIKPCM